MENKVVNLEVQSNLNATEKSVGNLKTQLRQAQNEVNALSEKFGATSKEAVNAAKKAAELRDRISDAKQLTDAFNPDAKFRALTNSLSGVAGGFGAIQGGMGLVGVESADLEKQLLKVQSAMAISQGLQSIGESVDSFKQLGAVIKNTSVAQKVLSASTAAYTFVTGAATTGLKLFRAALIGTGIGAIVVGLGLLIANFDKVKNAVLNLIPGLKSVGDFFGNIVNAVTDFVGATSDATRALDKLKAEADNTLKVNKKFMAEHGDQLDEYTKKKIEAKNAYAEAVKEDGANQVELAKRLNRELAAIEFSRGDEKRKLQKEANEKAEAERKAQRIKDLEDLKASLNAQKEANQNNINEVTDFISDSQDKQNEFLGTAQEAEEQKIKDKYFRLLELARQQNRSKSEIDVLEIQKMNELNDVRLVAQQKQYDEEKKIEEAKLEQKKAIKLAEEDLLMSGLSTLKNIFSKNKEIQKGVLLAENGIALAKLTMNTIEAVGKDNAASPLTFGMPWSGIHIGQGALGAANIISATSKGLAALGGGSAGSAPSMGSAPSGGGSSAPQFNVVGNTGMNQLAQTLGREQPPIKAYVTAGDVTTGQSLNRNIITNASLG